MSTPGCRADLNPDCVGERETRRREQEREECGRQEDQRAIREGRGTAEPTAPPWEIVGGAASGAGAAAAGGKWAVKKAAGNLKKGPRIGQWLKKRKGGVVIPWRGKPKILTGNAKKGWIHIRDKHITGEVPGGSRFVEGTTRKQIENAAKEVVAKGQRLSPPNRRVQRFVKRTNVNGRPDRVEVVVDSKTGEVITMFPQRRPGIGE